ncbi:dTDP-4-dehydrorhamnose 3,5-epimerase [Shewanella sp. BF02_Schw]|uniref:dTDP-4-dehydrorhamnose 3,5-epimerase n=1 Tax=Shewanella sp. BF02_Schw TaxID=394908 RepID=UPI00177C7A28|nr:dTDP-4-dehydrorhamnose 3,5-epimerase [Shewanella sp. BF02_Schw]MBO1895832.1 dTDP-4-dehydrorhamnose 3,5-epimerase [Shewanella sp. BF02_Schw]
MKVIDTTIADVKIIEPAVFGDERGFFMETWSQQKFEELVTGKETNFVQDNHSKSCKGVLRGLHYQKQPNAQGKLVRCVEGEVFDVAVDIRKNSSTFGQWVGVNLSAENKRQLWIPEGFAHGFLTLSKTAEFVYKATNYYAQESECAIKWNDTDININWPFHDVSLSSKDKASGSFENAEIFI